MKLLLRLLIFSIIIFALGIAALRIAASLETSERSIPHERTTNLNP